MKTHSKFNLILLIAVILFNNVYCTREEPLGLAELSTLSVTDITATSALGGGNISNDGGGPITSRGVVWATYSNPTVEQHIDLTMDGTGQGMFQSNISNLQPGTTYFLRAYAANEAGMAYGNELQFKTQGSVASLTTNAVKSITHNTAMTGGNVTDDGGESITAHGVVWGTSQNPTLEINLGSTIDGSGAGSYTSRLTGLSSNTNYYVRAYATNAEGTSYGQQESFTTFETHVVEVLNPTTGKIWMDRNLGATQAATSNTDAQAYGDLYQWGRAADGHQKRTSSQISTLSSTDTPGHGSFILVSSSPFDWRTPQNDNLWQGINGINNPCPDGYRLPTHIEWEAERQSWVSDNATGAFASPLKLPLSGFRNAANGMISNASSIGYFWSSTVAGVYTNVIYFASSSASPPSGSAQSTPGANAQGFSVRCIKD
jgi:uncharacterized protein (TIGR02145 family)